MKLSSLLKGLHRTLWREGSIPSERLEHTVDGQGNHHLAITFKAGEVLDDRVTPLKPRPLNLLGASAPGKPRDE